MATALAFLGLHLTPPVRELTRDATAVEARTLARANRLLLRALPRSAQAGPIGRAALAFAVEADRSRTAETASDTRETAARPQGTRETPARPHDTQETLTRLRRLAAALTRLRVVESVSLLVRPPGAAGTLEAAWLPSLPSVEVDAAEFEADPQALLPDRLYAVAPALDEEPEPARRALPLRPPRALPPGDEE